MELKKNNHEKMVEEDIKKQTKKASEAIERAVQNFGDTAERFGKRIEQKMESASKDFERWHDKKFGIFGPLIWSFLGIIILRFIIGLIAISGEELEIMKIVGDFLHNNFLVFSGLMVISSYNTYFYRKYKKQYRWVNPLISTTVFISILWLISQLYLLIDSNLEIPIFNTIAKFISTYYLVLFIVITLIIYGFMMVVFPFVKEGR
jgi:ABC-type multidrug transport system fused ATPase/permease subunit